jgi:hypothetical protein
MRGVPWNPLGNRPSRPRFRKNSINRGETIMDPQFKIACPACGTQYTVPESAG